MATFPIARDAGAGSVPDADAFGRIYKPRELAQLWSLSEQSIRRLFQDRSDVFKLESGKRGKRGYATLRIPRATAARVFAERSR